MQGTAGPGFIAVRSTVPRDSRRGTRWGLRGPIAETRRQSLLVRRRSSEREAIRFITAVADLKGWE
jgi:hypothetical protein